MLNSNYGLIAAVVTDVTKIMEAFFANFRNKATSASGSPNGSMNLSLSAEIRGATVTRHGSAHSVNTHFECCKHPLSLLRRRE